MTSRLSNLVLLASWLALHASTFRWLGRAWLRDEGQLHLVLAGLAGAWVLSRLSLAAVWSGLGRPLRPSLVAAVLAIGPVVLARVGPDLDTLHASLALVSAWGLYGGFVDAATWRRSAAPALLLAAVLPVTGTLDVLLGYPLRRVLAGVAATLTGSIDAGTVLAVDGRLAHVDLPCSGVRGLWSASVLLLGASVAWGRGLVGITVGALGLGLVLQLAQNLGRVTLLVLLTGVDPLLADVAHLPLGVLGFGLALVGPLAMVAAAAPLPPLPATETPRTPWLAPVASMALLALTTLERPAPAVQPSPTVAAPSGWRSLDARPDETAFFAEHGARLTKAAHPTGAQAALVSSRSWLAHHVPEQCHEAGGWSLSDDHAAPVGEHLVRIAHATRDGEQATALWWFRSADTVTDDHTVRIRAAWHDDAPWVLVSVLVPGHADPHDPALTELVAELDTAALAALEPR